MLAARSAPANPADWSEKDEHRLLERYIVIRERTSMTHQLKRAQLLFAKSANGELSNDRGSFQ